jgi:hypothetical protein
MRSRSIRQLIAGCQNAGVPDDEAQGALPGDSGKIGNITAVSDSTTGVSRGDFVAITVKQAESDCWQVYDHDLPQP